MAVIALIVLGLIPFIYTLWGTHTWGRAPSDEERKATLLKQLLVALLALGLLIYTQVQASQYQSSLLKGLDAAHKENAELREQLGQVKEQVRQGVAAILGYNRAELTIALCGKPSEDFTAADPKTSEPIRVVRYGEVELQFTPEGPFRHAFYKGKEIAERQVRQYLPRYPLNGARKPPAPPSQPEAPPPTQPSKDNDGGGLIVGIVVIVFLLWAFGKKKKT